MRLTKAIKEEELRILEDIYKDVKTALDYTTPFELLVAVILSAQCTDKRVNIITKRLFPLYSDPADMLALGEEKLQVLIKDCGLYRAKAANLIKTCYRLVHEFHGQVPADFDQLLTLPGVGRKTANVMMSVAFGVPALAVDTHVFRVSHRLGLAKGKTPDEVEAELKRLIPRDKWSEAHHWLIWHGRKLCKARKPLCGDCPLNTLCPSAFKEA